MRIFSVLVAFCFLAISNAYAGEKYRINKYPMPLIWDSKLVQNERARLVNNPSLKSDIDYIYKAWSESQCYSKDDYQTCLKTPSKAPKEDVFNDVLVATPDLNNDGKRDLILYLDSGTGLSGNGNCGIMSIWFYENTPNGYRNIGKTEYLRNQQILLGAPKQKGGFRDIISKDFSSFCSGADKTPYYYVHYNYKKRAYFDLSIAEGI